MKSHSDSIEVSIPAQKWGLTNCPGCAGTNIRFVDRCQLPVELAGSPDSFPQAWAQKFEHCDLLRCCGCGSYFRWPQPGSDELELFYRSLPSNYWKTEEMQPHAWSMARKCLADIFEDLPAPSVLDVGAFTGGFLRTLPAHWEKSAVEPSDHGADALQAAGIPVLARRVEDIEPSDAIESFDAVTMLDVLEHLPNPSACLSTLARVLKVGGVLVVSTGCPDHWSWQLLKGKHWYLHSIQHCCFMGERYFRGFCKRERLTILSSKAHPHFKSRNSTRVRQSAEVLFTWSRDKGVLIRKLANGMTRFPPLMHLRHKSSPPFTNGLHDHRMLVLQRL